MNVDLLSDKAGKSFEISAHLTRFVSLINHRTNLVALVHSI
jgi:hypothetical protein